MPKKTTLLYVEGDQVKIVFGNKLKCIPFDEIRLDYNQEFLDAIFCNTTVVKVDKIALLSKDQLGAMVGERAPKAPDSANGESDSPKKAIVARTSDPITSTEKPPLPGGLMPQSGGGDVYIVSTSEVTIIVDDLYTRNKIVRGGAQVPEAVSLLPGKPVNLSNLDQKSVKESNILRRMLRNGTVKQVGFDEAMEYNKAFEAQASASMFSVHDIPSGGMVNASAGVSEAQQMASNMFDSPSEITIDIGGRDLQHSGDGTNESSGSMSDLMTQLNQAETDGILGR